LQMSDEFKKWFPASAQKRFADFNPADPSVVVICFPNAGNSEDMFSSEGSGARRQPSALIDWVKANNGQLLSVQYPGRAGRKTEAFASSAQQIAAELLPVLAPVIKSKPYMIVAHSVGTWISFEMLVRARQQGLPMPRQAVLSAFPSPDIPVEERPWLVGAELSENEFKDEARQWSVTDDVFGEGLWGADGWNFHQIMRHDFALFDSYQYDASDKEPFDFPIQTYFATGDLKVSEQMVSGWSRFTTGSFACEPIEGHHLFPQIKEAKKLWLEKAAQVIGSASLAAPTPAAAAPAPAAAAPADDDSDDDLDFFM